MDIQEAFQIVLGLARQHARALDDGEKESEACDAVEDFVVNQLGDD